MTENVRITAVASAENPFAVAMSAEAAFAAAKRARTFASFPDLHIVTHWAHVRLLCIDDVAMARGRIFANAADKAAFLASATMTVVETYGPELAISMPAAGLRWQVTVTLNDRIVWPAEITVTFSSPAAPRRVTRWRELVDGTEFAYTVMF